MKKFFIEEKFKRAIHAIEIIIAVILMIGIVIGLIDLVKYFFEILQVPPDKSYDLFQAFLGHALLLIVGAELISMILYHSNKALLELILFVIARKMLIYATSMTDLVFGAVAIAIVFVTLKFLVKNDEEHSEDTGGEAGDKAVPAGNETEQGQ